MKTSNRTSILRIQSHVAAIREEHDTDTRIRMLHTLNTKLPKSKRLVLPSLITNAYIRRALDIVEERAMEKRLTRRLKDQKYRVGALASWPVGENTSLRNHLRTPKAEKRY